MKMERPQGLQRIWLNLMPTLPLQLLNSQVLETNIASKEGREFLNRPLPDFIEHDGNTFKLVVAEDIVAWDESMSGDSDFGKLQ